MTDKKISFKGNWVSTAANFSTVDKMFVTDGGYAVGRVATARNKYEAIDVGFKMAGMMFLNFIAPKYIAKFLDSVFNVSLDPLMLADKSFVEAVKNNKLKLPESGSEKEILKFIDNNPNSIFVKFARKFNKVKLLDNGIRDPRAYVDTQDLAKFSSDIKKFIKNAKSAKSIENYALKSKRIKSMSILTNIALSSALLAYGLPKAQFAFRKLVTGSDLEPGLAPAKKVL